MRKPAIRKITLSFVIIALSGLNFLIQGQALGTVDTSYFIPFDNDYNLIVSADRGSIENVKLLLSRGADINAVTYEGVTALMYAADKGNIEMVSLLLNEGANPDKKPWNEITALMSAARNNHFQVAELLAKKSEDLNLKDSNGVTAIHFAAAFNHFELADMLIFYGADVEIPDLKGNTPLITASYNNCYEAADILIQNGADVHKTDSNGYTALMAAIQEENNEIIKLLIENGSNINYKSSSGISPLLLSIANQNYSLTEKLFDLGVTLNQEKGRQMDLLDIAMKARDKEMAELLLANGIKPLKRPNFSKIALGPGVNLNFTDLMTGFNAGILDTKYNTGIYGGFFFRPSANRVLSFLNADTTYQYWERRYYFHVGLEKRISLSDNERGFQTGPMIGLTEVLTYGSYRGSNLKPDVRFITVPKAGWYYSGNNFLFQINYEYMNLKTPEIKSGRINISAFYTIMTNKRKMAAKRIDWLK
jgi:ankyrin repeat protein